MLLKFNTKKDAKSYRSWEVRGFELELGSRNKELGF